ncbi:hypothetical protein AaE_000930, partial [Aphanomyces astaci]
MMLRLRASTAMRGLRKSTIAATGLPTSRQLHMKISPAVKEALRIGTPLVALESTIISHGMPFPQNYTMATEVEALIREYGACPATIAILDGEICVGLSTEQLHTLASFGSQATKCSTRDVAAVVARRDTGATTVSSTMFVFIHTSFVLKWCMFLAGGLRMRRGSRCLSRAALAASIAAWKTRWVHMPFPNVFLHHNRPCIHSRHLHGPHGAVSHARGRGVRRRQVHPRYPPDPGILGNLCESAPLIFLELVGYQTRAFPAFFTTSSGGAQAHIQLNTPQEVASLIKTSQDLNLPNGFLVAVPNPAPVDSELIHLAIQDGLQECRDKHIAGNAVTPFLLKRVN